MAMAMEIATEFLRYLSGGEKPEHLRKGLMNLELDRPDEFDETARGLLFGFEGCYAEYIGGFLKEEFFRERLKGFLRGESTSQKTGFEVLIFLSSSPIQECSAEIGEVRLLSLATWDTSRAANLIQNPISRTPLHSLRPRGDLLSRHA